MTTRPPENDERPNPQSVCSAVRDVLRHHMVIDFGGNRARVLETEQTPSYRRLGTAINSLTCGNARNHEI